MKIGMLWFNNDPKSSLMDKIRGATEYYRQKYGATPNLCYVHPSQVGSWERIDGVDIRPSRSVLPNHFWVGVSSDTDK